MWKHSEKYEYELRVADNSTAICWESDRRGKLRKSSGTVLPAKYECVLCSLRKRGRAFQNAGSLCLFMTRMFGHGGIWTPASTRQSSVQRYHGQNARDMACYRYPFPWAERNSHFMIDLELHICKWLRTTSESCVQEPKQKNQNKFG